MGSRAIGFYTLTFGPKTVASLAITQRGQVCLVPELRREGL
ncbi:MAG TPA: hypothetical protein VK902_02845 [Rubrobacter sp.]|nr:hypothetical protein [Rubrobacter sp.]